MWYKTTPPTQSPCILCQVRGPVQKGPLDNWQTKARDINFTGHHLVLHLLWDPTASQRESRREELEPSRENQGKPLIIVAHSFSKAQNMFKSTYYRG